MEGASDLVREIGHGPHARPGIAAEPSTVPTGRFTVLGRRWRRRASAAILERMIVVLAGGVGAARFLRGLVRVAPGDVTVVGNTGDDFVVYGVHVSPDLDIVTYTLGGAIDEARGWGLAGDTHNVLEELRALGVDAWFTLGDRDYAVCLFRTLALAAGQTLSDVTARIAERYRAGVTLLPMTDAAVATHVTIVGEDGRERDLHFQEYWVRRGARDAVRSVRLDGVERARPGPDVLDAIASADAVLFAPSNPVVSIGTILAVPGIREAVSDTPAPVVGISPIVGGAPVRGMADKLMPSAGVEVSALGAATLYRDLLDGWVIDLVDADLADRIASELEVRVEVAQTLMHTVEDAAALAKVALELARSLTPR
jgi:LPPG:FO 2-phospho-L-lactate transferase